MFLKGNVFLAVMLMTTGVVLAEFHCTPGREFYLVIIVVALLLLL
jgi:hypothetical protein